MSPPEKPGIPATATIPSNAPDGSVIGHFSVYDAARPGASIVHWP